MASGYSQLLATHALPTFFIRTSAHKAAESTSKVEVAVFCNLIVEVTAHHFHHILFVRSKSLAPACTKGNRKGDSESRSVMSNSCGPMGSPRNSPGQNTGVGSLSLPRGIFPTQGANPDLSHCGQILYQLSHQGSPRILERVAYPSSSGSS